MTHITIYREKDVRSKWPLVSQGLEAIMARAPNNLGWSYHNVLGELMHNNNSASLYLVEVNDHPNGFIVTRILHDEFTRNKVFLIWLMYLEKEGVLDEVTRFCLAEGKRQHCKYVRFESNRPGWDRVVQRYGGKPRYTIYEKEI